MTHDHAPSASESIHLVRPRAASLPRAADLAARAAGLPGVAFAAVALTAAVALALGGCGNKSKAADGDTPAAAAQPAEPASPGGEAAHAAGAEGGDGHGDGHGNHHGAHHGGGHHHDHPPIPKGPVDEFHELLAPLWHAPKGAERMKNTCEATGKLIGSAEVIRDDPTPPEIDDSRGWLDASTALVSSIRELEAECKAAGSPAFEAKFSAVHDAFHALIDLGKK